MTTPYREEVNLPRPPSDSDLSGAFGQKLFDPGLFIQQLMRALYDQFRDDHKRLGAIERSLRMVPRKETVVTASLTTLSIRSTGTGAYDLTLANTENLTGNRTLVLKVNDSSRTLELTGSPSISGVTISGTAALATTNGTSITFPTFSAPLAQTAQAQTLTGVQTMNDGLLINASSVIAPSTTQGAEYVTTVFGTSVYNFRAPANGYIFRNNAGTALVTILDSGNTTYSGTLAASNLSGTNTGDQTMATLGTFSSATLRGQLTDEVGTGAAYFVGGALGTPASGTLSSCDSLPVTGVVGLSTAWTTYTPTIAAASGSFTTVSATGRYKQIGKTVCIKIVITITDIGTASGYITATLPVSAQASQGALSGSASTSGIGLSVVMDTGLAYIFKYDSTYYGPTGSVLTVTGTFESA